MERKNMSYSRKKTKTIDKFNDFCFITGFVILLFMATPVFLLFYTSNKMIEIYRERKNYGKKYQR